MKKQNKGFTVVELVIVIAVVAILAAVLIPTFISLIDKSNESNALSTANGLVKSLLPELVGEDSETDIIIFTVTGGKVYAYGFGHETRQIMAYRNSPCKELGDKTLDDVVTEVLQEMQEGGYIKPLFPAPTGDDWKVPANTKQMLVESGYDTAATAIRADFVIEDIFYGDPVDEPVTPEPEKGILMQSTLTVIKDRTFTLQAFITPEGKAATSEDVTWKSSDESVLTVDENGTLTAVASSTASATVTATRKDDTSISASCQVEVLVPVVEENEFEVTIDGPEIAPEMLYFSVGDKFTLDVPEGMGKVTWTSSDESYATVDADGNVECLKSSIVMLTGVEEGTGKEAVVIIEIRDPKVGTPFVSSSEMTINAGEPAQFLVLSNIAALGNSEIVIYDEESLAGKVIIDKTGKFEDGRVLVKVSTTSDAADMTIKLGVKYSYAKEEITGDFLSQYSEMMVYIYINDVVVENNTVRFDTGEHFKEDLITFVGGDQSVVKHIVFGYSEDDGNGGVMVNYGAAEKPVMASTFKKATVVDNSHMTVYWDETNGVVYVTSAGEITAPNDMMDMFSNYSNVEYIDLYNFTVKDTVTSFSNMFAGCSNLLKIYAPNNTSWAAYASNNSVKAVTPFDGCGKLTNYNEEQIRGYQGSSGKAYLGNTTFVLSEWSSFEGMFDFRTAE